MKSRRHTNAIVCLLLMVASGRFHFSPTRVRDLAHWNAEIRAVDADVEADSGKAIEICPNEGGALNPIRAAARKRYPPLPLVARQTCAQNASIS